MVGVDFAELVNNDGKRANFHAALLFKGVQLIGDRKILGNIQNGFGGDFGVCDGAAVAHRASKNVPAVADVVENGRVRGDRGSGGLGMDGWGESGS